MSFASSIIYNCDNCQQQIPDQRFHCPECEDFDLCPRCATQRKNKCYTPHHPPCFEEKGERLDFLDQVRSPSSMGYRLKKAFEVWEHRPCIGVRRQKNKSKTATNNDDDDDTVVSENNNNNNEEVHYEYETYGDVHRRCAPVAWKLVQLSLEHEEEQKQRRKQQQEEVATTTKKDDDDDDQDDDQQKDFPMIVAIILENCLEWLVWEFASALAGTVMVPIDVTASNDVISSILESTEPRVILTSSRRLGDILEIKKRKNNNSQSSSSLLSKMLIVNKQWNDDDDDDKSQQQQQQQDDYYTSFQDFFERDHRNNNNQDALPSIDYLTSPFYRNYPYRKSTDPFRFFSTSGSTGVPKLALVTHQSFTNGSFEIRDRRDPLVFGIYRPLSYATDLDNCYRAMGNGGRVALLEPPVERWLFGLELGKIVRPSSFSAPPRIFNVLYDRFCEEMKAAEEKVEKVLMEQIERAEERERSGKKNNNTTAGLDDIDDIEGENNNNNTESKSLDSWMSMITVEDADREQKSAYKQPIFQVWKKYRTEFFGNRLTAITIGSAPPRPEVLQWMRDCFQLRGGIRVFESFGTTECGGVLTDDRVSYNAKIKLIPIEGDEEQQRIASATNSDKKVRRGEICAITDGMIEGYWKNKEATDKLFYIDPVTKEKWIRTGDIGELNLRDGTYKVVGRINCVKKLANGVFFSPEPIEVSLSKCSEIRDLCVHAEAGWDAPIAIISFHEEEEPKSSTTSSVSEKEKEKEQQQKLRILRTLREIGAKDGVPATLLPCAVIISPEHFTRENNLLTVSMKISRPNIKHRFMQEMEDEIKKIENERRERQQNQQQHQNQNVSDENDNNNKNSSSSSSIKFLVISAFENVLGRKLTTDDDINNQSAVTLGADSIQIGVLREKIASTTTVHIPLREFGFMKVRDVIDKATFQCFPNAGEDEDMAMYKTNSMTMGGDNNDDDNNTNNNTNNNNSNCTMKPPSNVQEETEEVRINHNKEDNNNTNNNNVEDEEGMGKKTATSFNFYDPEQLDSSTDSGKVLLRKFKEKLARDISPFGALRGQQEQQEQEQRTQQYIENWKSGKLKPRNNNSNGSGRKVYLLTGATGFIGIHVLEQLLRTNTSSSSSSSLPIVICLIRPSPSNSGDFPSSSASSSNQNHNHHPHHLALVDKLRSAATNLNLDPTSFIDPALADGRLILIRSDLSCKTKEQQQQQEHVDNNGNDNGIINLEDWKYFVVNNNKSAITSSDSTNTTTDTVTVVTDVILLAANVNHYLPYPQLSRPNVTCNRDILNFLFDEKLEPPRVVFGSSVSVNPLLGGEDGGNGNGNGNSNERRTRKDLSSEYYESNDSGNNNINNNNNNTEVVNHLLRKVSGYGLSKWAAERLMENCGHVGLLDPKQSSIARIGMVSWNRKTGGANVGDWLVTLTAAINIVGKLPLFSSASLMNNKGMVMMMMTGSSSSSSSWKSSPLLFRKQQEQLLSRNKFFMRLSPVDWMAEKIVSMLMNDKIGKYYNNDNDKDDDNHDIHYDPPIALLDNAITVEMVSQVWKPMIEKQFIGNDKDNNKNDKEHHKNSNNNNNTDDPLSSSHLPLAIVVPEWNKFMEELKMKDVTIRTTTPTTKRLPSVSQRCELLFGTESSPSGDRLTQQVLSVDDKNDDDEDSLGISKLIEFISHNKCVNP